MRSDFFIGLDIGTTSTKAIVFSATGEIKGIANYGYPLLVPQPGWSEQNPDEIFQTVNRALRDAILNADVNANDIAAIGISGAMHSLIAIDAQNQRLTNSITWADTRSNVQANRLHNNIALYQRTGTPIHPMSPLTKIKWMRETEPELFQRVGKFVSVKEYILYQWFGQYVVDYSIASATGLFNLQKLDWDDEALSIAEIRPTQLSQLVPTTHILRGMKSEWASAIGLDSNVPVVVGASDGVLANLGVGALNPNQIAITIGTSAAVRGTINQPITDAHGRTFCYAFADDRWVIGGASNNGGIILRWFRDHFGESEIQQAKQQNISAYDLLEQMANQIAPGAEGLVFLPFLSGERAPKWNADARGVFFGVALHHTRSHFARAILEGVLYNVYEITTILKQQMTDAQTILASGGFAQSAIWLQLLADVFGTEVQVPEVYEASGFGAAMWSAIAVGAMTIDQIPSLIRIQTRYQPNLESHAIYQKQFQFYQHLYDLLVSTFSEQQKTLAD